MTGNGQWAVTNLCREVKIAKSEAAPITTLPLKDTFKCTEEVGPTELLPDAGLTAKLSGLLVVVMLPFVLSLTMRNPVESPGFRAQAQVEQGVTRSGLGRFD
jgi:hypothetical protein